MKTILGTEIPENIRGVYYICHYNYLENSITVLNEVLCSFAHMALNLYAEIPNPESQLAMGNSHEQLCEELERLHKNMKDKKWLKELSEQL
jgi:hypothetical protein